MEVCICQTEHLFIDLHVITPTLKNKLQKKFQNLYRENDDDDDSKTSFFRNSFSRPFTILP